MKVIVVLSCHHSTQASCYIELVSHRHCLIQVLNLEPAEGWDAQCSQTNKHNIITSKVVRRNHKAVQQKHTHVLVGQNHNWLNQMHTI